MEGGDSMKRTFLCCALLMVGATVSAPASRGLQLTNEQRVVREHVEKYYVEGVANRGAEAAFDDGFHEEFVLLGAGEGRSVWTWGIDDWKGYQNRLKKEGKLPRTGDERVSARFLSIDVHGTLAVVQLELRFGGVPRYIDCLSLYKLDGGWRIVSKVFHHISGENQEQS